MFPFWDDVEEDLPLSPGRRLKAPQENGAVLADPALSAVGHILRLNQRQFEDLQSCNPYLAALRTEARQACLAAARDYMVSAGEPLPDLGVGGQGHIFMAGHQPELFHPGVWVKNFALSGLAHTHAGIGLNLVVDNDTVKSTVLRVPVLSGHSLSTPEPPALLSVPFDRWTGEIPYENRLIADREVFFSFGDRVIELMGRGPFEPLLTAFWPEVVRQASRSPLMGECLAAARREWERAWGCHNLELPLSALCRTRPFHLFACHLLANLPAFQAVYNDAVHGYRARNGIHSRNHPVPDLSSQGEWLEAPFWGWRAEHNRRGRLFARLKRDCVELRCDAEPWPTLPGPPGSHGQAVAEAMGELEEKGFKIRSRALTTTLFARMFLADLFVHGIGGGKYDELTDELIRRFYGLEPLAFLVLSATLWLPVEHEHRRQLMARRQLVARWRRDMYWNPQRHLGDPAVAPDVPPEVAAEKSKWIAYSPANATERRTRFETLRSLSAALRPALRLREAQLTEELARLDQQLNAAAVLERRDYAFVLYPEDYLRPFVTQFLATPASATTTP
jgi:hypothetical protein